MNPEFGVSPLISTLGLSLFVLGFAVGPAIASPLSESYGRKPIYVVCWSLFILFTVPSAAAKNIETITTTRFFGGFFGGTVLSAAGGTVADIFPPNNIQMAMALVSTAPFVGPCTGPLLGGFINYYLDWRWTYYIILLWSSTILVLVLFFMPETQHAVRLRDKASNLRQETGDNRYRAPMEMMAAASTVSTVRTAVFRPFELLIHEPMCLFLNIYSAILLGILYLFFVAFPIVFRAQYGMNLWQVGLTFLSIINGMCVAAVTGPLWSNVRQRLVKGLGGSEPEFRLPPAMLGGLLIPIGLFWFAWTASPDIHWLVPLTGCAVFGCG
jgi:multidrug resistance protein